MTTKGKTILAAYFLKPLAIGIAAVTLVMAPGVYAYWTVHAISMKARGAASDCPWDRTIAFALYSHRFSARFQSLRQSAHVIAEDSKLGIEQVSTPIRTFWAKKAGDNFNGRDLVAYLLTEHDWVAEADPQQTVHSGDVVIDCGAHIGVFTSKALRLGARKVIAVEPDPTNLECFRRNLSSEIASGRVIVISQGVWNSAGTMKLYLGRSNSGTNSMVFDQGDGFEEVPVTTIDEIVRTLGLTRVDFIKMDIEGAEREALRGGMATLKGFRPRLMLDSYHRPDDMFVLPRIIREAHADYSFHCGPCEEEFGKLVPHAIFFE